MGRRRLPTKFDDADLAQLADVHLEIGKLGDTEGAAGSIYMTMPVVFYGKLTMGSPFAARLT